MKNSLTLFLSLMFTIHSIAQLATPKFGTIKRLPQFQSVYVAPRNIDIWLPPNYSANKKYAVLYMHDGQMLFDTTITWNKQAWKVDQSINSLLQNQQIINCIVVGVWNNGEYRHAEYFPQKALDYADTSVKQALIEKEFHGKPLADNYLQFLVKELKPYIDQHYSTNPNPEHTFIAGSSMGGLISIYALCQYPNVFSGAACLSTHWVGSLTYKDQLNGIFNQYLQAHLPPPTHHKIYFDYGNKTLDSLYQPYQLQIDSTLKAKKYTQTHWITQSYPGEDHSENAWSKRFHVPLLFLLRKKNK